MAKCGAAPLICFASASGADVQMDRSQGGAMFDYSSFTRGRIVASKGAWDGADPVAEIA